MTEVRPVLGNHLKALRFDRGFTQADLALQVNVTRKTINTIENQVFVPSTILALKLAQVFQLPVEEVFYLPEGHCE